jgi:hypothetical protein
VSPPQTSVSAEQHLPVVVTQLMKGVVYRDTHEKVWWHLTQLQPQVRDYVAVLGLEVVVDDAEGYGFLRALPEPEESEDRPAPVRLVPRRQLSFHVSLLLALLRKKLAEFDAGAGDADTRLMLSREQIIEMIRLFLPAASNEARLVDQIDAHIAKVVELGFLRRMKGQESVFEVRRIVKAFVDGQWLSEFNDRLAAYAAQLGGEDAVSAPQARGARWTEERGTSDEGSARLKRAKAARGAQ